ncbi:protein LURP-one-related 8-like [Lolium rigidum]|uniref:protein LURP-one-related 8-like n=1 Tax=Lolium rigidum TaxID=89674 RepID=UPI001F5C0B79|nr:protein LURP-one-related 8-like [Lolium rigidum]
MAKVHPNIAVPVSPAGAVVEEEQQQPTVLTVWRKSLLFNCEGFTVFDATGGLAFRVDRYGSSSYGGRRRRRAEDVVLMDAAGKPLLTVRRKIKLSLSLGEHWVVYDGDASDAGAKPLLSVRRHHVGLHRRASDKTLAHITPLGSSSEAAAYVVEGSYGRLSCAVRDAREGGAAALAEVRRKESVGDDVFRLVVSDHRMDSALSMGIVIALDQMFGGASSRTSLLPRSWSA